MHREKRLGLAMGLLIVAIVGAFFFRLKPTSHDQLPPLAQQEKIDEIIEQMPAGPYLAGLEEDNSPIPQSESQHRFSQKRPLWNMPESTNKQQLANNTSKTKPSATTTLSPIPQEQKRKTFSVSQRRIIKPAKKNQTGISSNSIEEPVFDLPPIEVSLKKEIFKKPEPSHTEPSHTTFKARPYRVKAGDTLSSLAEKYLGDKNRYQEIYRANKSKLRSADDLRVGMLIRMPFVPRLVLQKKAGSVSKIRDVFDDAPKPLKKDYHLSVETKEEQKKNAPLRQWPFTNRK
ncbi:hypothetical protein MNBD_PLANCTO02-2268 [hydrothermal vent metagenome]|uniref:LysM domain-containing protein n=1 Tax=hydrothermal vent metagenome TaxID=652676 RepID=A0A3B1E4P8_9ZZZZ